MSESFELLRQISASAERQGLHPVYAVRMMLPAVSPEMIEEAAAANYRERVERWFATVQAEHGLSSLIEGGEE